MSSTLEFTEQSSVQICGPVWLYAIIATIVGVCTFLLAMYYGSYSGGASQLICTLISSLCCCLMLLLICNIPNVGKPIAWVIVICLICGLLCNCSANISVLSGKASIEKVN